MQKAIILAGGSGKRMGLGYNKVLSELRGKPLLAHTIENFQSCPDIDEIVIAAGNDTDQSAVNDISEVQKIVSDYDFSKVSAVVSGGQTRMLSVECGLAAAQPGNKDLVLIQDGGRPFTPPALLSEMIASAQEHGACICGQTPKDTIQLIDENENAIETYDRSKLVAIYTPLVAKWALLGPAREKAKREGYLETTGFEDSAILQKNGVAVKVVRCDYTNIKVTTPEDMVMAEHVADLFKAVT